jgi:circadian clock protein KaiB
MMKGRRRERGGNETAKAATYVFRLFVAGNESNSAQARENLGRFCEEHIKGRYKIETVDVLKGAETAHKNHVLVTPTLILIKPRPQVTVLGNLSDTRRVLAALGLVGEQR